jgi:hypothetical protein
MISWKRYEQFKRKNMKKMTPREALYYICVELGPAQTLRNDNLTEKEIRLRDAIRTLQNFVTYHDDADLEIPDSANEYRHYDREGLEGKDRLEAWKKELPPLTREDFIE